jgi:hypothetical protein
MMKIALKEPTVKQMREHSISWFTTHGMMEDRSRVVDSIVADHPATVRVISKGTAEDRADVAWAAKMQNRTTAVKAEVIVDANPEIEDDNIPVLYPEPLITEYTDEEYDTMPEPDEVEAMELDALHEEWMEQLEVEHKMEMEQEMLTDNSQPLIQLIEVELT